MVKVEESLEALTHARWPGNERSNERNMDALPNLMLEDPVIKGQHGQCRNTALHANTITLTPSVARQRSCYSLMLPPLRLTLFDGLTAISKV